MECLTDLITQAIMHTDIKHLKTYLDRGPVNVNKITSTGMTLLGTAAQTGSLQAVKTLLDHKPYKNIGYFVVEKDLDEFGDGPTPDGMEHLEWDMEMDADSVGEKEKEFDNIYQWYASILNRSSVLLKSPDHDAARLDSHGRSVLHYAIISGSLDLVRYLLEHHAEFSVQQPDSSSLSPLHLAAMQCNPPLVRYLTDRGAEVNCACRDRRTPLHLAAQRANAEIVRFLIENGAEVNVFDMRERSPLAVAVAAQRGGLQGSEFALRALEVVRVLVEAGARVNCEDANGFTALRRAVWNDSTEMALVLLAAGAKVVQSHWLVHAAARSNNVELVRGLWGAGALLNIRDEQGNTPLMVACSRKNAHVATFLLRNGANVNAVNSINGMTTLHITVQDIREKRCVEAIIELLVNYGADLNATSYQGTVLFYSIILENLHAAEALVRHGVDVNLRDERAYFDNLSLAKRHGSLALVKLIVYAGFCWRNLAFELATLRSGRDDEVHDFLTRMRREPMGLREICRVRIRGCLNGGRLMENIGRLPLPVWLQRYLALEIL